MKLREASGNGDMISRLEAAETKLQELKSNMGVLGKEAVAAMTAVEAQQQRLTLQRLIALVHSLYCSVFWVVVYYFLVSLELCYCVSLHSLTELKVESERNYHQRVLQILDQLEREVLIVSHYFLTMLVLKKHHIFNKNPFVSGILMKHSYFSRWYPSAKELKEHLLRLLKVPCHLHLHMKKSTVYS